MSNNPNGFKKTKTTAYNDSSDYEVEKIVDKKFVHTSGKEFLPYYLIKWKGYPASENTWEPITHLDKCGKLLYDFELSNFLKFEDNPNDPANIYVDVRENPNDVGKPRVPKEIIGRYQIPVTEEIYYLFQWQDREEPSLMTYEEANAKFPDFMLKFYEEHLDLSKIEVKIEKTEETASQLTEVSKIVKKEAKPKKSKSKKSKSKK